MKRAKHSYKKRDERLCEILQTALGRRFAVKQTKEFTLYKMARWIDLSPSTRLKQMLDQLVGEGYLNRVERQHRGNVVKHVYSLTQEALDKWAML